MTFQELSKTLMQSYMDLLNITARQEEQAAKEALAFKLQQAIEGLKGAYVEAHYEGLKQGLDQADKFWSTRATTKDAA